MDTLGQYFLNEIFAKSTDIADLYGISSSSMTKIYKGLDINFLNEENISKKGPAKKLSEDTTRAILAYRKYPFANKAKIISLLTNKGGVGKSTATYFLSYRLASYGFRVLLIDTDSQGNSTTATNVEKLGKELSEETPVLLDILNNDVTIEEAIVYYSKNLHLLPSTQLNSNLPEFIKMKFNNFSTTIRKIIEPVQHKYDFILIDCAPSLDTRNAAIACSSDLVLLFAIPDKFSKTSIKQTVELLDSLENDFNIKITRKIVFNRFDAREYITMKYLGEIAEMYKGIVLSTVLRTTTDYKNCIDKNEDLFSLSKSKGKDDFTELAIEILNFLSDYKFNKKELQ